jgi:hypothetical protein
MAKARSRTRPKARRSPSERVLTLRDLNRATLARQMLLARAPVGATEAVQRLVGLQAQLAGPPYVGLWTRLTRFERGELARRIEERAVVRATMMRATLHLATAEDYLRFRPVLEPALSRALQAIPGQRTKGFDLATLATDARRCLRGGPRTFAEIRASLAKRHPGLDVRAMGYAVRLHVPLVQVPGTGAWGFPSDPAFALAESWLGQPVGQSPDPRPLVLRYLAAFGPATARDFQTWSGLPALRDAIEALRPELRVRKGEDGRDLLDLPDAPLPSGDEPAPPRLLPEFDNLLLGHADRARIVPPAHRSRVFLPGLRVRATFLVDGFVRGAWRIERTRKAAALVIEPFASLRREERAALAEEGERLLRFVAEEAAAWEVRFAKV